MSSLFKKIISALVLTSFIVIVLFSFSFIMHGPNGQMPGDCPFSGMEASLCPQNNISIVFHHISSYKSFINIPVNFGITALIIFFLLFVYTILTIAINLLLFKSPPNFSRTLYNFLLNIFYKRKITHWLSLLENSPSTI